MKDVKSKLEQLEKLKSQLSIFTDKNNSEECKNLLENLCDGLEKFLGYNKDSKGYDGSGIVYSDLDRLCDGVMGFLFNIITHVKKDKNLEKYNDKLPGILEKIKQAQYNRKEHFDSSIAAVSQGIRDWVSGVEERNEKVMEPLRELQLRLKGHMSASLEYESLIDQLQNWQGFAGDYLGSVQVTETALDEVDTKLKDKLLPTIGYVKQSIANFGDAVNDQTVVNSVNELNDKFTTQYSDVTSYIGTQIHRVQSTLNDRFSTIERNIRDLTNQKQKHIKSIRDAVEEANKLADGLVGQPSNGFDLTYTQHITQQFKEIRSRIEEFAKNRGADTTLQAQFSIIQTEVKELEDDVCAGLEVLQKSISSIDNDVNDPSMGDNNVVSQQLRALAEAKLELDKITSEKNSAPGNLQNDFETYIKKVLSGLVGEVADAITDVGKNSGITGNSMAEIIRNIKLELNSIVKGNGFHNAGLQSIVTAADSYAKSFTNNFEFAVKALVSNAVNSNEGTIHKYVADYVGADTSHHPQLTVNNVKKALNNYVHFYVAQLVKEAAKAAGLSGIRHFAELAERLDRFGQYALTYRMHNGTAESRVTDALEKIKGDLQLWRSLPSSATDNETHLTNAIKSILTTIHSVAKGAIDEIQRFMKESHINQLESISQMAKQLDGKLREDLAGKVDSKLGELKTEVDRKIVSKFTGQLRKPLEAAVTKFYENAISHIKAAATASIIEALEKFKITSGGSRIDVRAMMKQFYESKNVLTVAVEGIAKQLELLKKLPDDVDTKGQNVKNVMDNLQARVKGIAAKISAVLPKVEAAGKAVQSAIEALVASLNSARETAILELAALQGNLQQRFRHAFNELEDGVQKMFAEQKKVELTAMHTVISESISTLQTIIDADFKTGLKGLMNKLHSTFNTKGLKRPNDELQTYANRVKEYCDTLFSDFKNQKDILPDQGKLTPLSSALSALLSTMHQHKHFSATVSLRLAELQTQLNHLTPAKFAEASPLLDVVKAGVRAFHGELAKQYVSRYSGRQFEGEMVKQKEASGTKTVTPSPAKPGDNTEITEYGRKCAKVFLTLLATLSNDFVTLGEKCKGSQFQRIYASSENNKNVLGDFLSDCGFIVSESYNGQDTELKNKEEFTGTIIYNTLLIGNKRDIANIPSVVEWMKEKNKQNNITPAQDSAATTIDIFQLHDYLYGCLKSYYEVCHYATLSSTKYPSSLFQMLCWLTGLPHSPIYQNFSLNGFSDLFPKPKEQRFENEGDFISIEDTDDVPLSAHPENITVGHLTGTLTAVCTQSHTVLTSILGHGHAGSTYAVDFNTNPHGFTYPPATGSCLDMLADILCRLYQQLFFLYGQCSNEEPSVSWRDCWYGNLVGGSDWKCNAMQCPNQKGNQIHKQMCNQKCDQTAECGIKSPLQSFLEDGLPGFLPHSFTKPGCKLECTYSNHRGIPCRTPMGFGDISVAASHRQRGEYLKKVLEDFCGSESAPLTKLCAQLRCILQKPPQTLGDIFAFYYGYITDYTGGFYGMKKSKTHTKQAFREAANEAYFCQPYAALDPRILLDNTSHLDAHSKGDLISITGCTSETVVPCGLYVKSLTQEISKYYSSEHKANHLSWIVYITETFCDLLKKLYDDCCKKCGPAGSKCHVKSCDEKCEIRYSDEEEKRKALKDKSHKDACTSIITCRDTYPTLYKYGFTFGNIRGLNSSGPNIKSRRTCKDFCEALKLMLVESSVLIELRKQIDQFLWDIRTPFSYLVLALWSLSLFYLICVMVGRLDVLHIRSHLRIPSSHRITAQSLLAAAQVGRLAKISYLQP